MRLDTKEKRAQYRAITVPKGAVRDPRSSEAAEVFTYEYQSTGAFYVMAFWGSSGKPSFHYRYKSAELREVKISAFFANAGSHREYVATRRAKAAEFKHTLKVGDIVHTSWGYDQTNVSFFEVTRIVSEKSVGIREIRCTMRETGFMCGQVTANPGEFTGPEKVRRVRDGNVVVNAEYSYSGFPGAGPTYTSSYA